MSEDDQRAFREAMNGVRPLPARARPCGAAPSRARSRVLRAPTNARCCARACCHRRITALLDTGDELSFRRRWIREELLRKLRRGPFLALPPRSTCTASVAMTRTRRCGTSSPSRSHRRLGCVRVIHGKGRGSGPRGPVLKHVVNHWLRRMDDVAAFATARPVDGGTGAVYVLLASAGARRAAARRARRQYGSPRRRRFRPGIPDDLVQHRRRERAARQLERQRRSTSSSNVHARSRTGRAQAAALVLEALRSSSAHSAGSRGLDRGLDGRERLAAARADPAAPQRAARVDVHGLAPRRQSASIAERERSCAGRRASRPRPAAGDSSCRADSRGQHRVEHGAARRREREAALAAVARRRRRPAPSRARPRLLPSRPKRCGPK